ncbi:MAG: FtsX-like permease family protein, partial [Saprospiraceae bacterium]|nr:FtsX-like permease family protein [Saprospiraceae bacterium]
RVENFALASFQSKTKGVLVVGSEPDKEQHLTHLSDRVVEGRYLRDSFDILLAAELSEYLNTDIGDSVVILSQGRHGANAAGLFYVAGIVEFGSPDLNGQISFVSLEDAQSLFAMNGMTSSVVIDIPSEEVLPETKEYVRSHLPDEGYEVMDYKELLPDIMQAKEFDELSSFVIIIVLYLLIGFGVFGTLLMMLRERQYEFGILKAIGFKYQQLYGVVWLEIIAIAIGGALSGILLAVPFAWYFQENPIRFSGDMAEVYESYGLEAVLPFSLDFVILFNQALVVTILTTLMSVYAFWKIRDLRAVKAMRG